MRLRQISLIPAAAALFVIFAVQAAEPAKPHTFITVDIPQSLSTTVFGINSNRDIVGAFETAFPPEFGLPPDFKWFHGFVLRNGKLTTVDAPFSILTQIRGINERGDVVGTFIPIQNVGAPGGGFRGLVIRNGGPLTTVDFQPTHFNTILMRITPNGTIIGCYHDIGIDSGPQDSMHGITISPNGVMTSIDDEVHGVQFGGGMHTGTANNGKKKAGFLWDHDPRFNRSRGYEIEKDKFVLFDVPGSLYTQAWDVNNSGDIVGMYGDGDVVADAHLRARGFLKSNDTYQSIVYPGAVDTRAFGISASGDIVGTYQNADGHTHGFVALVQPYIQAAAANGSTNLKLPAAMQNATTVLAALTPIDKSAPIAKSGGQAPACHGVNVDAAPASKQFPITDSIKRPYVSNILTMLVSAAREDPGYSPSIAIKTGNTR